MKAAERFPGLKLTMAFPSYTILLGRMLAVKVALPSLGKMRDKLQITEILMPALKVYIAAWVTEYLTQSYQFQQCNNLPKNLGNEAAANQGNSQITSM